MKPFAAQRSRHVLLSGSLLLGALIVAPMTAYAAHLTSGAPYLPQYLTIGPGQSPGQTMADSAPASSGNLALNRPAVSSSDESSSLTPNLAVDGDGGTRWGSQFSDPQWIYVDLGRIYAITRVRLTWEVAYGKSYRIQVSNDAVNWRTLYRTSAGGGGVDDLAVSGIGRYVRVYGTARGTPYGYSLWEFEVYGAGAPAPTATPVPPTATAVPPTATPVPPTATAVPPTATPVLPTATAAPRTATPVPPTVTPTATPSGGNPQPIGQTGWSLVFRDEFDGSSLDASKWVTCYPWWNPQTGCTNTGNNELQWYVPGGVSVSGGTLKLTARRETVTGTNGVTYDYTSGMVSTGPSQGAPARFAYVYGFVEARMKLPAGRGYWPAFWTLPTDQSWPPEIDGMEAAGHKPTTITMNVHWTGAAGHQQDYSAYSGPDFTAGWHTVGVEWTATSLVWYVDGVARKTFSDPAGIPVKPEYILLNLAIDGNHAPDGTTPFPGVFEVDYVRAWQR